MTEFALFFTAGELVDGQGYRAYARVRGRMLAVKTDTGFEIYGVNPGGLAVYARSLREAYPRFVEEIRLVLEDIASDGRGFADFRREAKDFFSRPGRANLQRWTEARERARRGEIDTELGFPIERGDRQLGIDVELLDESSSTAPESSLGVIEALAA